MRKFFVLFFLTIITFACSRKTVPSSEIIISNPSSTSDTKIISQSNAPKNELTTGKTIYINRCGRCHALKPIEKFSTQEWNEILKDMIPRANLTDSEAKEVTAFVLANSKKNQQ